MKNLVFEIEDLKCEYIKGKPVLEIKKLFVPRGKLLFVIGKSGIGKSTLIETLGLMNKTISSRENTKIKFFPKGTDTSIELKNSWNLPNHEISAFRKSYFSFVFQNTNLMPNFTAGENMMMSLLIKGKDIVEAKEDVSRVMERLSLAKGVFDKKITELSGGQRQRLAFVRAITADFDVLFGDEPTGNLDEDTANELMGILKELVVEEKKTGIIVSHDLKLAERFADVILPITIKENSEQQEVGMIETKNILTKNNEQWSGNKGELLKEPLAYLRQFLNSKSLRKS